MAKVTWKPGTMLSPLPPVLVSCGTLTQPNVMTVAWTGIICSDPVLTYVSIRPSRFSHDIIKESGEFVINIPTWKQVAAVDYCGVKSGRNFDKFKEMNLTASPCTQISAPQIEECPLSIECKVKSVTPYGTHDMFLAEVIAVNVDETYIDEKGALDLEKAGVLAFAHGKYYTLGRNLGSFGFSVNKEMLKQKQKMATLEVVEKKSSPIANLKEKSDKNTDSNRHYHRTPFGIRPDKDNRKRNDRNEGEKSFAPHKNKSHFSGKPRHHNSDVVQETVSRPNKRYDKVKKVPSEYLKTDITGKKGTFKRKPFAKK